MKRIRLKIPSLLLIIPVTGLLISCGSEGKETGNDNKEDTSHGIVLENMDTTVSPREDFFKYVNGNWLSNNEIPDEESSWGSFNELRDNNNDVLLAVLEEAAANEEYEEGSDERKVAEFYRVGIDSSKAENLGLKPLAPFLKSIDNITDQKSLQKVVGDLHTYGVDALWGFFVLQDLKQSDVMTAYLYQDGLGLPDRDYYTKEDKDSEKIRKQYVEHVANMLELMGEDAGKAANDAEVIMKLETQLANASMTAVEQRNIPALYNKKSVKQINKISPAVDWKMYLSDIGLTDLDTLIVAQPDFIEEVSKVINSYALNDIKTYLKWHLIHDAADYLSHDFVKEDFNFYGKTLSGNKEMRPRWKRVLSTTNASVGEALGKLYVAKVFPPEAKQSAQDMVDNIKVAFAERIKDLEWMSDSTKQQALKKLEAFTVKIGYPDKWLGYAGLEITDEAYITNVLNANKFEFEREIDKIGKPVDPTLWGMTPPTVNAYYNPVMNEIVFPAGILQPPFYDYKADAAVNYGGIGAVIGHEITHGFDDQGRRFDADGNLKDWWTKEDGERFDEKAARVVKQYSGYEALDSLTVNGELTLGENIADIGGLAVAYDGLQRHLKKEGDPGKIDGFTPEQRFFLSWATIWRIKMRPETLKQRLITDPHSPGAFRANGPLSGFAPFHTAFDVQPGDPMYRPDSLRGNIW